MRYFHEVEATVAFVDEEEELHFELYEFDVQFECPVHDREYVERAIRAVERIVSEYDQAVVMTLMNQAPPRTRVVFVPFIPDYDTVAFQIVAEMKRVCPAPVVVTQVGINDEMCIDEGEMPQMIAPCDFSQPVYAAHMLEVPTHMFANNDLTYDSTSDVPFTYHDEYPQCACNDRCPCDGDEV